MKLRWASEHSKCQVPECFDPAFVAASTGDRAGKGLAPKLVGKKIPVFRSSARIVPAGGNPTKPGGESF